MCSWLHLPCYQGCQYWRRPSLCGGAHLRPDRHAVAIGKNCTTVGHFPMKSQICSLSLRIGGRINGTVSGDRRCSRCPPQVGLEILCSVIFKPLPEEFNTFCVNYQDVMDIFNCLSPH